MKKQAGPMNGPPSFFNPTNGGLPPINGGHARSGADSFASTSDTTRFGGAFVVNSGGGAMPLGLIALGVIVLMVLKK